jgi:hypothetical protein
MVDAHRQANSGLLDIIAKGGGERATEAAGPVMPGMAQPSVMSKIPMSEAFASYGKDHPLAMDSSLKLALDAQGTEREDAFNQRKMDLEQSRYADQQNQWQQSFDQNKAHLRAMEGNAAASLALQRENAKRDWEYKERQLNDPWTQAAKYESVVPGSGAEFLSRALGGHSTATAPGTERDDGSIGGYTPNIPPKSTAGQPSGTNVAALMDSVAAKKTAAASVERLDKITNDPALRSATEDYRKGRLALESVAELVNTGELQSMDRQMVAKRLVQSVEPGNSVNAGEAESALTRMGTAGVYVKNWIDDVFADGTRVGPAQIKRALEQLAINVNAQRQSALDMLENKRQYGAATGVIQQHLPLIGAGFVDGGDPRQLASDAWKIYSTKGQPVAGSGLTGRAAELEMERSAILAKRGWK